MLGRRCKRQVLAWERVELARVMPASAANIRSQRNREMIRAAAVTARESACTMHAGTGTSSEATAAALGEAEEGERDVAWRPTCSEYSQGEGMQSESAKQKISTVPCSEDRP